MHAITKYFAKHPGIYFVFALILGAPALLINLGMNPLTTDEPIRGLVALEMVISDNYITPTMFGEFYMKKPPLFNWILVLSTRVFGSFSEFALRFPTLIFLSSYILTIYLILKKHFTKKFAFLGAIVTLTCGRILFWDSQLALIDILYSWVTFTAFYAVFHYHRKNKLLMLFIATYSLSAIGFLLKGLPTVVFQGTTLIVFFIYQKEFRKLFSWKHFVGILIFILITGTYYTIYLQYNPNSLDDIFITLFGETTRRTLIRFGLLKTILHIFTFPVEMLYHFAPWTLLIVFLFKRGSIRKIKSHPLIQYFAIVFMANIIVYWTSPEVYPRYLLMLFPLFFIVLLFLYEQDKGERNLLIRIVEAVFFGVGAIASLGFIAVHFHPVTHTFPYIWPKTTGLFIIMVFMLFLYIKIPKHRLILFGLILLTLRIGFNWFILPARNVMADNVKVKTSAIKAAQISKGKPLKIFEHAPVDFITAFYITRERMEILSREKSGKDTTSYYLSPVFKKEVKYMEVIYRFNVDWEDKPILLVKFKKNKG